MQWSTFTARGSVVCIAKSQAPSFCDPPNVCLKWILKPCLLRPPGSPAMEEIDNVGIYLKKKTSWYFGYTPRSEAGSKQHPLAQVCSVSGTAATAACARVSP